jgi:hypothetical protein
MVPEKCEAGSGDTSRPQADCYASGQGDPRGVQVGNEPAETVVENL